MPSNEDDDEPEAGRAVDREGPGDRRGIAVDVGRGDQAGDGIEVQLYKRVFDPAGRLDHPRLVTYIEREFFVVTIC